MPRKKRLSVKRRRQRGKRKQKKQAMRVPIDRSMETFEVQQDNSVEDDGYVLVLPDLTLGYFEKFV